MNPAPLRARSLGRRGLFVVGALAALLAVPLPSDAATITGSWQAKLGSGGANGTAKVVSYLTGTGSVTLKLLKLKPSTLLPVTIYKGTCSAVGAKVTALASIKTTSTGAATRTSALTAAQTRAITNAATTGKITIRVGSGSTAKCGAFAAQPIRPYVAARITVGTSPSGVVIAPNGVWVTNWWDNTISHINPATNTVLQTIPLTITGTGGPEAIAYGDNSLWVTITDYDTNGDAVAASVIRVDPTSGQQTATIPVGKGAYDIEDAGGAVWVPLFDDKSVVRIDPATNQVSATIPMTSEPTGLAFGAGSLWVADNDGKITRIDPATNMATTSIQTQDTGGYVIFAQNAVWVTNSGHKDAADGRVTRIDPATNTVAASVVVGATPEELAFGGGSIWVGLYDAPTVVQINATTGVIANRVTTSDTVYAIAATSHSVWAVHNISAAEGASEPPKGEVTRINF